MNNAPVKEGYADVYGSEFVAPGDIQPGKRLTVIIASHNVRTLEGFANGKKLAAKKKVVLTCTNLKGEPCKAKIACNKTSAKRLFAEWGEFDGWVGKSVTVESGMVMGKPAVLLTPIKGATTTVKTAPAQPTVAPEDDLSFGGDIPDHRESQEN